MAKVKINSAEYESIEENVRKAFTSLEEAEDIWGTNFDNLYHNFVESGFLDSLYEDAKSNFYDLLRTTSAITCGVGIAILVPVGGWIAAAIGLIFGIVAYKLQGDPDWITVSRDTFIQLLADCRAGNDDNYIQMTNEATKLYNVQIALERIRSKVNEFNQIYANMTETADSLGVKTALADDGMTVTGIDTTVTIDGQTIEMSTAEAMNAFFTYTNTVMDAEIAADYLNREYGYDIDFNEIVKNANSFMTDTINSGLYTNEFINHLLPSYNPDENAAYDAATQATQIDNDKIRTTLQNYQPGGGDLALYGGLLGMALIGPVGGGTNNIDDPGNTGGPDDTDPGNTNPGGNTTDPGGNTTYPNNPNPGGNTGGPGGGTTPTNPDPGDTDDDDDDNTGEEPENPEDENPEEGVGEDFEYEEVVEVELPDDVAPDFGEVDYDKLAREQYEFDTDINEIVEHRNLLIEEIQKAYETGDLTNLELKLREYGYNEAEIEAILNDKFMSFKAILEGDEKSILAASALALAQADGVTDFDTAWDNRPNFADLSYDGPSELLTLPSEDDGIRQLRTDVQTAREDYQKVCDETNEVLKDVSAKKQELADIKAKYEEQYGEDYSKWSKEAATEYNDAVKAYNEAADKATTQLEALETSRTNYNEAQLAFENAKKEYYEKLKAEHDASAEAVDEQTDFPEGGDVVADDGTLGISLGDTGSVVVENGVEVETGNEGTGTNVDSGGVVADDGGLGFNI